jgi:hypothetical protein
MEPRQLPGLFVGPLIGLIWVMALIFCSGDCFTCFKKATLFLFDLKKIMVIPKSFNHGSDKLSKRHYEGRSSLYAGRLKDLCL